MSPVRVLFALSMCFALSNTRVALGAVTGGPPKSPPRRADIKFIKCAVCQLLARNVYDQAQELLEGRKHGVKVEETSVIDLVERSTVSWKREGEWMTRLHLQANAAGTLAVRDMGQDGECGEACRTVERAAVEVMGEHDTDVAEALFVGKKSRSAFEGWMCNELTGACRAAPPRLPKGHAPYAAFQPRPAGSQNIERVIGEMEEKGLKGTMYSREDMMRKYAEEQGVGEGEGEAFGASGGADVREAVDRAKGLWAEHEGRRGEQGASEEL